MAVKNIGLRPRMSKNIRISNISICIHFLWYPKPPKNIFKHVVQSVLPKGVLNEGKKAHLQDSIRQNVLKIGILI